MMKSETCFSTQGTPLSVYDTEDEAQGSADYQRQENGIELYPYRCKKCGLYHLAPQESRINVLDADCGCRDSQGGRKTLYVTEEDARKVAESRMRKGERTLRVYRCPMRSGWHITHTEI